MDRLNRLYLKRAEAGRDRRAKAALKDTYLKNLTLVLIPFLLGLGTIALVSTTSSHRCGGRSRSRRWQVRWGAH